MGKLKKTLRQKKLADLHALKNTSSNVTTSSPLTYSLPEERPANKITHAQRSSVQVIDYRTIRRDLYKTLFLTSAIIIAELILFFVI